MASKSIKTAKAKPAGKKPPAKKASGRKATPSKPASTAKRRASTRAKKPTKAQLAKQAKQQAAIRARRLHVMDRVTAGWSYRRIAEDVGVSIGTISDDVNSSLAELREETDLYTENHVKLEEIRLDKMLSAIWAKVEAGDFQAIDRALKIMERKAKLLGYDQLSAEQSEFLRLLTNASNDELITSAKATISGYDST